METTQGAVFAPTQSETIEKLAAAIVAAQAELTNPPKSKQVYAGKQRYSFAPLPEILDAVRPVLKKHTLAVLQMVVDRSLVTRLVHASGQWIASAYPLPTTNDAQAMGSAITYARRYSLCAMLAIAGEDDEDGQAAVEADHDDADRRKAEAAEVLEQLKSKGAKVKAVPPIVKAPPAPEPEPEPEAEVVELPEGIDDRLAEKMAADGITAAQLKAYYVGKGHLPSSVDVTDLPVDYVTMLVKKDNWKKAVEAIKGGK